MEHSDLDLSRNVCSAQSLSVKVGAGNYLDDYSDFSSFLIQYREIRQI